MYTERVTGSIVGACHTPAPEGPYICVPTEFLTVGCAGSVIV
jgi:hypothetical protein